MPLSPCAKLSNRAICPRCGPSLQVVRDRYRMIQIYNLQYWGLIDAGLACRGRSTWQASAMCDKLYRFVWVFRLGGVTQKGMSTNVRHAQLIYTLFVISLFNSVWNCCGVFFFLLAESVEGGAYQNDSTDCGTKSCLNSKVSAVWIRNVCLEYPNRSAMKCVKIGKKHLKHRCLADVSRSTSSSSDMVSCLSSIHMLMLNQAAQSGSISNHLFFLSKQSIYLGDR